jgi:hypothetical protein
MLLAPETKYSNPSGINGTLAHWAEDFIGVFQKGAEQFTGLVTGIIPLLIVLLTAVNAAIRLIGPERIDRLGQVAGRSGLRYYPLRYLLLPVPAGEAQAGVLRLVGQLRPPDPRDLSARQSRRVLRLRGDRRRHHQATPAAR